MKTYIFLLAILFIISSSTFSQVMFTTSIDGSQKTPPVSTTTVTPNQVDNFQDGTTQNWTSGSLDPNQPVVLAGGFGGASDKFLRVVSSGSTNAGGKIVFFNTIQWLGNYNSANIVNISM